LVSIGCCSWNSELSLYSVSFTIHMIGFEVLTAVSTKMAVFVLSTCFLVYIVLHLHQLSEVINDLCNIK
jgi:hypothetical protein